MKATKNLTGSQVELKIELTAEDLKPHLSNAASRISRNLNIPGFRPGKAPYEMVRKSVGEEQIFQEAVDDAINQSLIEAMKQENVYPYGDPDLHIDKMVPLQQVEYTVKMDVYPEVTLGEWPTDKVKKNPVTVTKDELDAALKDLTKMLVKEEVVERAAKLGDRAYVDFDVLVNGVPIEGGSSKEYPIIIGEGKMIPGFEDQMIGMKAGENKDFKLTFPKEYKPDLASKEADFKIGMKQVLERIEPEVNDELAKRLGVESKDALMAKLEDNIKSEKENKEMQRAEIEAVKKVVDAAKVGEIPHKMAHDEVHRILHEFEYDLSQQGIALNDYLANIGKKVDELEKEFEPKAVDRIKTSLVIDQLAERENVKVDEKAVDAEWERQKQFYGNQPQTLSEVEKPAYRNHLRNRLAKIRTIDLITAKLVE